MSMIKIVSPKRFILFIFIILIVVVLVFSSQISSTEIKKSGQIEIESGTAAVVLWGQLEEEEFTGNTLTWRYWASRLDANDSLQAGVYRLEKGEKVKDVVQRFATGDVVPSELSITFPEGFTLEQIAERAAENGIGTTEDFLAAAVPENFVNQFAFLADIPAGRDLEGYLFPDTYRVHEEDTPTDLITRMLATFEQRLGDQLRNEIAASNRTLDQIVIMASIVEREVISDEDMALVAGVLWTRFDEGAGLDADATTRYAVNKPKEPLTLQDLDSDSPYNTRKFRGLPPGPISSPGLRALVATVRPEESEYYFYLSAPSGETIFSVTNDEHNANKFKYLR